MYKSGEAKQPVRYAPGWLNFGVCEYNSFADLKSPDFAAGFGHAGFAMATIITERTRLKIPAHVLDLESFRKWVHKPTFPEKLRAWWLNGEVWVDLCREEIFRHVVLKGAFYSGLLNDPDIDDQGCLFSTGIFYSNTPADLAGNPDGVFVSTEAVSTGRVQFVDVARDGRDFDEIQGTPDMILDVVNDSSAVKDTEELFEPYWRAGIPEYWLADGRSSPAKFDIWKHTPAGYISARKKDGWVKSNVFGKSFRLIEKTDRSGHPDYRLEVR